MFRAYDSERDRLVAVKVFRLGLAPERVHRLVAELDRLIAAGLAHAGVAAPLAAGIEGTLAYLASEYVAADSLDIVLRDQGALPAREVLRITAQLAGALDFAAVVHVNHGALHPRDVLMAQDEPRLTGLGIVRALERAGASPPIRRPYTAPERITGTEWDRRADVFSLAALVHELLWGRRVAALGEAAAESLTEVTGADLDALRGVFARALAEDPERRFVTALVFAKELIQACPGVPQGVGAPAAARRQTAARPEEPRLPLEPPEGVGPDVAQSDARAASEAARDLELRIVDTAEAPRGGDVVVISSPPADQVEGGPAPAPLLESAIEQSRSAVWPLVLALAIGVAVGFAGGYGVGVRVPVGSPNVPEASAPSANAAAGVAGEAALAETANRPAAAASPGDRPVGIPAPLPPSKPTPVVLPAPTGRIVIRSAPEGARVWLDGRDFGLTPVTLGELASGTYRVRIARDGYRLVERRVVLTPSKLAQSLSVKLARAPAAPAARAKATAGAGTGTLTIESRPAGAKAFVDGKLVGTTPLSLPKLAAGDHAVRLERDGYRRWASSVRVTTGEPSRVTASLER